MMKGKKKWMACAVAAVMVFSLGSSAVMAEEAEPVQEAAVTYDLSYTEDVSDAGYDAYVEAPVESYSESVYEYEEIATADDDFADADASESADEEAASDETADEKAASEADSDEYQVVTLAASDVEEDAEEADTEAEEETEEETEEAEEETEEEADDEEEAEAAGIATFAATADVKIDAETFPDAVLRDYIEFCYDTNGDGILEADEIDAVTNLMIVDNNEDFGDIRSLEGLEVFTSLELLDLTYVDLDYLDLSGFESLKTLHAPGLSTNDGSIDLSNCTSLETINVARGSNISSINITGCSSLESVISDGAITLYVDDNTSIPQVQKYEMVDGGEVLVDNPDVTIINIDETGEPVSGNGGNGSGSTTASTASEDSSSSQEASEGSTAESVDTDDSTPIGLYLSIMLLAMIAFAGTAIIRRVKA